MKKVIATILAFVTLLGAVAVGVPENGIGFGLGASAAELDDFGDCGENVSWELMDDGVMTISGTGDMYNYDDEGNSAPWEGKGWFGGASVEKVIIEDGVTGIGDYAFSGCRKLKEIIIPDSVTSIGAYAFKNCELLGNINFPKYITSIGSYAFMFCNSFTDFTMPSNVSVVPEGMLWGCEKLDKVTLHSSVTRIDDFAFYYLPIKEIELPESVKELGGYIFGSCDELEKVTFPSSLESVGNGLFSGCESLPEIIIPECMTEIKKSMFFGCNAITSVEIPSRITAIGESAFSSCISLKEVKLHEGVTSIGNSAFSSCEELETVDIPSSVSYIGEEVFRECSSIEEVNIAAGNKNYCSDGGVLFNKDKTVLLAYPANNSRTSYSVPDSVREIGPSAFFSCKNLQHVTMNNNVTRIGEWAFMYCSNLVSVKLPETVEKMGDACFHSCNKLKRLVLPKGTKYLGYMCYMCYDLEYVKIPEGVLGNAFGFVGASIDKAIIPEGVEALEFDAFYGCDKMKYIAIPSTVTYIEDYALGKCNSLKDIYYSGSEEDWKEIYIISAGNREIIEQATVHYNCKVDYENEIVFSFGAGEVNVSKDTDLKVEKIDNPDAENENVVHVLEKVSEKYVLYDISLEENGVSVQPSAPLEIVIPIPEGWDADRCKAYYIAADGTYKDMNAVVENGHLVFTTDHFSYYAIVQRPVRLPGDTNSDGAVDMKDSTVLRRYLAGWDVTIDEANADVNGDGKVNLLDSTILRRNLAGWEGVELK